MSKVQSHYVRHAHHGAAYAHEVIRAMRRQVAASKALVAFVSGHTSHVDAALQTQFAALLAELAQATTDLEGQLLEPQEPSC